MPYATPDTVPRLGAEDYRRIGAFRQALRDFMAFSDAGARREGLTPQQHQALLAIKAHAGPGPMTVSGLAERMIIKTHSAVGLVGRLVERDLVERRSAPDDRRRVELVLRPRGEAALAAVSGANLDQLDGLATSLDALLKSVRRLERGARGSGG